jgi:hypothetical protein
VLQAPRFNERWLRVAASNWVLSSSLRVLSGGYLTASTGIDQQLLGNGAGIQRPNQILPNALCDDPRPACWINPNAFAQPALGTLGNSGRSSIPGPGTWEEDMALSRIFRVREKMTLEARGEAFNLTNSFRAGPVTTGKNSPNFGQILTAQDPRILQVAMKFVF